MIYSVSSISISAASRAFYNRMKQCNHGVLSVRQKNTEMNFGRKKMKHYTMKKISVFKKHKCRQRGDNQIINVTVCNIL